MNLEKLKNSQHILLEDIERTAAFWLKNGWDKENGGIYTSLDKEGNIYSTDKSVWMQGRTAWVYAYLCNVYGVRDEWLEFSKSCLDFLEEHCINHAAGGRLYFTVTAEGRPLRQRRYRFSESFYIIANAEYAALTGDKEVLQRARDMYNFISKVNSGEIEDPVKMPPKTDPETRQFRALGDPMIYMNVANIMYRCDPENQEIYKQQMRNAVDIIRKYHIKEELHATLENTGINGETYLDISEGRHVNPGHDIECSWFLLQAADILADEDIAKTGLLVYNNAVKSGWDDKYQGITYFVDALGKPVFQLESDMKLWWPQSEMLIASIMAYRKTEDEKYLDDFRKSLNYIEDNFSDKENGGWLGYLHYDNTPAMSSVKGGIFKGPFHELRGLVTAEQELSALLEKHKS